MIKYTAELLAPRRTILISFVVGRLLAESDIEHPFDLRMLYVVHERDQVKTAKLRPSKNRTSIFVAFYEHLFDSTSECQTANFSIPFSRNRLKWKELYCTFSIQIFM